MMNIKFLQRHELKQLASLVYDSYGQAKDSE